MNEKGRYKLEANYRIERDHSFVLKEKDVKKLWSILEENVGETYSNIGFSDFIDRKANSIEEVLSFENSSKRKIQRIELYAKSESGENTSRVVFSNTKYRTIEISATGIDSVVTRLSDNISEAVDGLKPWYSKVSKVDFVYVVGFILTIILILFKSMHPDTNQSKGLEFEQSIQMLVVLFGVIAGLFGLIKGLNYLKNIYFPIASFAIGQGLERYRVQEQIRWGVIVASIVSLMASAVFTLVT